MAYDVGRVLSRGVPFVVENAELMGHAKLSGKRAATVEKRMCDAVLSVAGAKGSRSAKFLTDREIAKIRDPFIRDLVIAAAVATTWPGATGGAPRGGSSVYGGSSGSASDRVPDPDGSIYQREGRRGPYEDQHGSGSSPFDESDGGRGGSEYYWDVDGGRGGSSQYWDVDTGSDGPVLF